jgi:hypothetical protein
MVFWYNDGAGMKKIGKHNWNLMLQIRAINKFKVEGRTNYERNVI